MSTKVLSGENKGDHVRLNLEQKGKEFTFDSEICLVSIGRIPNT